MSATPDPTHSERIQRRHYDRIIDAYDTHYEDPHSQAYRRRFFHAPLLAGLRLDDRLVLEAMCGSGAATSDLLARGARVVVTGHSHKPGQLERDGILYVNPGSAGPRRFRLPVAVAELLIEKGGVRARIVELDVAGPRR